MHKVHFCVIDKFKIWYWLQETHHIQIGLSDYESWIPINPFLNFELKRKGKVSFKKIDQTNKYLISLFKFFAQRFAHQEEKKLSKLMVSPRLPYQVQTADMFPPTNNKKASLCPNLKPQTHKYHWQAVLRHHQPPNLSRDLLLLLPMRFPYYF